MLEALQFHVIHLLIIVLHGFPKHWRPDLFLIMPNHYFEITFDRNLKNLFLICYNLSFLCFYAFNCFFLGNFFSPENKNIVKVFLLHSANVHET